MKQEESLDSFYAVTDQTEVEPDTMGTGLLHFQLSILEEFSSVIDIDLFSLS